LRFEAWEQGTDGALGGLRKSRPRSVLPPLRRKKVKTKSSERRKSVFENTAGECLLRLQSGEKALNGVEGVHGTNQEK